MFTRPFKKLALITSIITLSFSCIAAETATISSEKSAAQAQSYDGLTKVENTAEGRVIYLNTDADFSQYKYIQILKAHVAFVKNWQKDFNRKNRSTIGVVTDEDIIKIKERVSKTFDDTFKRAFNENGYPVVDVAKKNTLLIRPALVDLDLVNTGTFAPKNSRTFTKENESVTLYIELYDGITGEILARIAENKYITENEYYGWQNRSRNNSDMIRLLTAWATELKDYLDSAHQNKTLKGQ